MPSRPWPTAAAAATPPVRPRWLSAGAYDRVPKIARTIAGLGQSATLEPALASEARQCRRQTGADLVA